MAYAALLLLSAFLPELGFAGRSVVAPPYMRRIIFEFSKKDPATGMGTHVYSDGTQIGMIMSVNVTMTNLSGETQTGRVFLSGEAVAGEHMRTDPINTRTMICGGSTSSGVNSMPTGPATFSIGPYGIATVDAVVFYTATYGAAGPSGHVLFDTRFNPLIRIEIDQDRGALNATMVPTWDGPTGGGMCDGSSNAGFAPAWEVSESRTGVPLLINGGRPF